MFIFLLLGIKSERTVSMKPKIYTIDLKIITEELEKAFAIKEENLTHAIYLDGVPIIKNTTILEFSKTERYTLIHNWSITKTTEESYHESAETFYKLTYNDKTLFESQYHIAIEHKLNEGKKAKYYSYFQLNGEDDVYEIPRQAFYLLIEPEETVKSLAFI